MTGMDRIPDRYDGREEFSTHEVCEVLGVPYVTLLKRIRAGKVAAYQLDGKPPYIIPRWSLETQLALADAPPAQA